MLPVYHRSILLYTALGSPCRRSNLRGFNPSIGLTSVPTPLRLAREAKSRCFNPSIGLTSVPTSPPLYVQSQRFCFNPSIGLTSVPTLDTAFQTRTPTGRFNPSIGLTSVPTSEYVPLAILQGPVSIPRSGLQAFRRQCLQAFFPPNGVSIPRSGLQAFRLLEKAATLNFEEGFNPSIGLTSVPTPVLCPDRDELMEFQSLDRG